MNKEEAVQQIVDSGIFSQVGGLSGRGVVISGKTGTGKTMTTMLLRNALVNNKGMHYMGTLNFNDDVGVLRVINNISEQLSNLEIGLDNCFIILEDMPSGMLELLMDMIFSRLMSQSKLTVIITRNDYLRGVDCLGDRNLFPVHITTLKGMDQSYTVIANYTKEIVAELKVTLGNR